MKQENKVETPEHSPKTQAGHKGLILAFALLLACLMVTGFLFGLRPKTSEMEKRKLAELPTLSLEGIWSGEYFSQITDWYSDTYPLREAMLNQGNGFKRLYGLHGQEFYGQVDREAEEIPASPGTKAAVIVSGETTTVPEPATTVPEPVEGPTTTVPEPTTTVPEPTTTVPEPVEGTTPASTTLAPTTPALTTPAPTTPAPTTPAPTTPAPTTPAPTTPAPTTPAPTTPEPTTPAPTTPEPTTPAPTTPAPTTPEPTTPAPTTPAPTTPVPEPTTPVPEPVEGTTTAAPTTPAPTTAPAPKPVETVGNIYIMNGQAFNLYYFALDNANFYASMVNTVRSKLPAHVTLYNILAPTAFGALSPEKQKELGGSNQRDAAAYIYSIMDDSVRRVPAMDNIINHNSEYIFFRSDHHWTMLGAYYAYESWCYSKGIAPHPLSYFGRSYTFPGFLGTFYAGSNQSPSLAANPDTVVAYVPNGTNAAELVDQGGQAKPWSVIQDVSGWTASSKYSCFIGGDNPLTIIRNPAIQDGSAVLLIKESFGNSFAPFLVDHYQTVYVVDYRHYHGNLVQFVQEKNIGDVIILNYMEAAARYNASLILNLFP